jgi:serine phosphatase RsbU (regulator of sigma subunit)
MLEPGDRMLMFTDGVTEARNENGEEFGEDRLIELLGRLRDLEAEALKNRLIEELVEYSGGNFDDDVTLLVAANR